MDLYLIVFLLFVFGREESCIVGVCYWFGDYLYNVWGVLKGEK